MELDLEEEEDWLDKWLEVDMESCQEEQKDVIGDLLRLSLDDHMDMDMEMKYETDYMAWLEKELQEIGIGEEVMECIRTMACDGDCKDKCGLETKRYEYIGPAREIEDCVRSVHCIGNCQDKCSMKTANNEDNRYGSIMQPTLDSTLAKDMQDVHCPGLCTRANSDNNKVRSESENIAANSQNTKSDNNRNMNSSDCVCVSTIQKTHTKCAEDITFGPVKGLACINRPGWKSSQAVHASGVSGPGGAKSSVHGGPQLDWSKWLGGVHISPEGPSNYNVTGIKYCPGENLPAYQYLEYKPRCSKTRNTTFVYVQDVETMPKSVTTHPEEMEVVIIVDRLEEAENNTMADTKFISVKEMVEDWDRKFTVEDQVEFGDKKEGDKVDRRTSDRFRRLTNCFEESEQQGVGGSEEVEILGSNSEVTDKPTYTTTNYTFRYSSFSEMGRKSEVKLNIPRPRQQKLCVVRKESSLLDEISSNGKRVREVECEIDLPVSLNRKKLKVSPMCTPE